MGIVIVSPDETKKIKELLEFASKEENWHHVNDSVIPGELTLYTVQLGTYRCVFTYTHINEKVFKHLSISCADRTKVPSPTTALFIADEFGIDPTQPGFGMGCNEEEMTAVVVQRVPL